MFMLIKSKNSKLSFFVDVERGLSTLTGSKKMITRIFHVFNYFFLIAFLNRFTSKNLIPP